MKTLGIDLRCLPADGSAGGGIAHAARAVTKEILRQHPNTVLYVPQGAVMDVEARSIVPLSNVRRASLVDALRQRPCDVLFVPSGAVSPGLPVQSVPWVHDCDIFNHPEWFPQSWFKRMLTTSLFLKGIRRAPHVFTPSEYTKQAIERLVPAARGRITLTGEGGGDDALAAISADRLPSAKADARTQIVSSGITRRFVLMLGTLEPRKNISFICRLWPEVAKMIPEVDLVIAGQDGWKTALIHAAIDKCQQRLESLDSHILLIQKPYGGGRREFTEQDRHHLMLAADLVLVPSLSEGFGLVALDAIQAGTPVLTSDRGALPEVTGDPGMDPKNELKWKNAMVDALADPAVREQIVVRQSSRRVYFSWEKTARCILKTLSS